ncbi:Polycystin Cation Channel (PCC) Family [Phytophthora cinnamomi]|uniref:Polycystin Cation Channel (PCC) Family n=1 Tax=Phytophthora cinnamomi TaxID=4785 RepID=UPI00355A0F56|nr:Polycystin Cation Channel (PCC) Family [Phytophthora cinnamomi]
MPWTDMYVILSPDPCTAVQTKDPPPPTISVHDALDVLWHDAHHAWDLRRIVMALFSFAIFIAAAFVHVPTRTMYNQSHAVLSALATSGGDTVTDNSPVKFLNIETIPDTLDWINDTFVPQVFVTEDAYGEDLPGNEWGRVSLFNQVLGGVSFDVTRMKKRDCQTEVFLRGLYGSCYDSEYTTTYDFVIAYNKTAAEASDILAGKGDWLNASTKELVITVPTLNSEIPGYVVTTLKLDFRTGGYIKPSFTTTPTLADHYPNTRRIVIDALVVLWFSPWMLIMTVTTYAIRHYKSRRGTADPVKFAH